jgi:diguanylate cyclase (GGDEF)-like protein
VAPFITVSVGVATLRPERSDESGFGRLLKLADDALYQAKRDGRNRSVSAMRAEVARSA